MYNVKWQVWGNTLNEDIYNKYEKIENVKSANGFWAFVE